GDLSAPTLPLSRFDPPLEPAARSPQTLSWPAAPEQTTTPAVPSRVDASAARPPTESHGAESSGPEITPPRQSGALTPLVLRLLERVPEHRSTMQQVRQALTTLAAGLAGSPGDLSAPTLPLSRFDPLLEPAARSQQTLCWPAAPEQTTTSAVPTRVDASAARPPTEYKGLSGPQQLLIGAITVVLLTTCVLVTMFVGGSTVESGHTPALASTSGVAAGSVPVLPLQPGHSDPTPVITPPIPVIPVLVGVGHGLAALQKWPGLWWWVPVTAVGLAVIVSGIGPLWQRWREYEAAAAGKVRRSVRGTRGPAGDRLSTVAEADLGMLRVHPAVVDVPYLHRRAKEQQVRERLRAGQPVLLIGSSMVGKTRLAAAVVRDLYPHRPVLIPDTTSALAALDEADMLPGDHVIWLDDLDRYLSGGALTAGLIMRLAKRNVVVATLRAREWDRFQPTDQLRPPEWDALSVFDKITLDRDRDQPSEEDLAQAVPDVESRERITRVGIGEYVGAAERIADQLALGAQSHPLGYALVRGAVDWRRTGITRPVPASLLPALAAAHLTPRQRASLADGERYADAVAWASREINPTVAVLEPGDGVFTVYDFALDLLTATGDAPPADTWQLVLDNAEPDELVAVGYQAEVTYGQHDVAQRAWWRAADADNTRAMYNLGVLLQQRGDLVEAQSWYRRAADADDTRAMSYLEMLLQQRRGLTARLVRTPAGP
ncbi:MAG TPA: hypothetical protein VF734_06990, partial [Pseudonocardiaceae bacterium]